MNAKADINVSKTNLGLPKIWTFEVVTPLHIGSGEVLSYNGYDFRFDNGRLYFPDFSKIFPEGGTIPKFRSWDKDGISGSPSWSEYSSSPMPVPAPESIDTGIIASEKEPSSSFRGPSGNSLEARIASASSFEEVGQLIGLDKKFPQKWAACKMEADFRKLLNQNDLVKKCERLPKDWDLAKDSTIGNYWLSKKSETALPSGATSKSSKETTVREERGEFSGLNELHQFIRDGFGIPYVPGSSLKGSLRTVLQAARERFDGDRRSKNMCRPADKSDPRDRGGAQTGDLGRLLQVCDSPLAHTNLALFKVNVLSKSGIGVPLYVEAALPGSKFAAFIRIDECLEIAKIKGKLRDHSNPDQAWLLREESGDKCWHAIKGMLQNYNEKVAGYQAAGLIRRAEKSMDEKPSKAMKQAANWLKSTVLASPADFLQIGFASGWSGMTGIPAMFSDERMLIDTANSIGNRFYRAKLKDGNYGPINPFPLSFRLANTKEGWRPMGWVRIIK